VRRLLVLVLVVVAAVASRTPAMGGAASDTIRVRGAGPDASFLDWLGGGPWAP
jgi:hypothetical protein